METRNRFGGLAVSGAVLSCFTPSECVVVFPGGADLTPAYLFEEDAIHFHKTLKVLQACCDL